MTRHFLDLADAGARRHRRDAGRRARSQGGARRLAQGPRRCRRAARRPCAGLRVREELDPHPRVSFDMAMRQLGGTAIVLDSGTMQLGRGETIADTARVLSGYCDAIMLRTDDHAKLEEMARTPRVPVINGLTDASHPCQIMADLLTIVEAGKALPGLKVAWLGDGNNVLASIVEAAALMQFDVVAACPQGFAARRGGDRRARRAARASCARPARGGGGRRHRRHRHLDLDGPGACRDQARRAGAVSGRRRADGAGQARREVPPLPARASRRGGDAPR